MRGLIVVVVIVGLVGIMALGPRWLGSRGETGNTRQEAAEGRLPACRPLTEICQWQQDNGIATLSMAGQGNDELRLEVQLPEASEQVMVVLTGESMYMGEYPLRLESGNVPGHYRAVFTPPFCTTGPEMEWQVELRTEGQTAPMPFRILFLASEATSTPSDQAG